LSLVLCLKAVERERCTSLYGVPTMFIAELASPDFKATGSIVIAHRDYCRRVGTHGADAAP